MDVAWEGEAVQRRGEVAERVVYKGSMWSCILKGLNYVLKVKRTANEVVT